MEKDVAKNIVDKILYKGNYAKRKEDEYTEAVEKVNEKLNKAVLQKNDTIFYWKGKYEASRELYRTPRSRDIDYEKEEAYHLLQKILLIGVIILQFSQLK